MKRKHGFLAILLFLLVSRGFSQQVPPDIESKMKAAFEGKIVTIRSFYRGTDLNYDKDGGVEGNPKPGLWTVDGRFRISKVKLDGSKCVFEGDRLGTLFDTGEKKLRFLKLYKTKLKIQLNSNEVESTLDAAIGKVFLRSEKQLPEVLPAYWRFFLEHPFEEFAPKGLDPSGARISGWQEAAPVGTAEPKSAAGGAPDYFMEDGTPVFRAVGQSTPFFFVAKGKITPPKLKYNPDPKYPEVVREKTHNGITKFWALIGVDGTVKELYVLSPSGLGFDDAAADAIKQWKFEPARLKGEPVPVKINIEMNFR